MAEAKAKIIISAVDQTQAALNSIQSGLGGLQSTVAKLGVTLSAGAFVAWTKGMIDAADELNDLSQRIGVGIKELAGYKLAAEQSGASLETVARGIKGLATYMTAHSKNLKEAGIQAKTTDEMMVKLADIFAKMPDGLDKTALAVKLFGKAGTDLIPMLNLGSQGLQEARDKAEAYGEKMAELAPQADQFNDQLSEISLNAKAIGLNVANEMMPALNGFTAWLADLAAGGKRAETALEFLTDRSPLARGLAQIKQVTDVAWALAGVGGDPSKRSVTGKIGGNITAPAPAATAATDDAARKAKILIGQQDEAAKKAADTYKQLTESIAAYQAQLDAQAEKQDKLTKADELAIQAKLKLTAAQAAQLQPMLDKIAADERELALQQEIDKRAADNLANAEKETASIREQLAAQLEHNETIGLTTEQLAELEAARIDEQIAAKQTLLALFPETEARSAQVQEIQAQVDALNELKSAKLEGAARQTIADNIKRNTEEWKRFTDDIESSLTDALMRGFEDGKGGMRNFIDSLKNTLKTAALKIVVQAIVSPVMGSVQGIGGVIAGSSGFGGSSSGIGGFGSPSMLTSLTGNSIGYGISNFGGLLSGAPVGPQAPGSIGGMLSGAGQYANWQYGLAGLGGGLLGGALGGEMGSTLGSIGGSIGLAVGGPIGGVIGSVAGGLLGGVFGGDDEAPPKAYINQYRTDNMTPDFQAYLNLVGDMGVNTPFGFLSFATQHMPGDDRVNSTQYANQYLKPVAAADQVIASLLKPDEIAKVAASFGYEVWNLNGNPNAAGGALEARLARISNAIGGWVDKMADTTTGTLEESYAEIALLLEIRNNDVMKKLTDDMYAATGKISFDGLNALATGVQQFTDMFSTDAERFAAYSEQMQAALESLNVALPESREGFKELVEGIDTSTKSGFELYTSLIGLAPAMDQYYTALASIAGEANNLSTDMFKTRADYLYAQKTGTLPHYAAGGDHAGGWAMVGEQGPELVNLGPARIYSNSQTASMLNTAGLESKIEALRADLRAGQAAMARSLNVLEKKVKQWDGEGMPAVRA